MYGAINRAKSAAWIGAQYSDIVFDSVSEYLQNGGNIPLAVFSAAAKHGPQYVARNIASKAVHAIYRRVMSQNEPMPYKRYSRNYTRKRSYKKPVRKRTYKRKAFYKKRTFAPRRRYTSTGKYTRASTLAMRIRKIASAVKSQVPYAS